MPDSTTDEKPCKHCGYCPTCGRANPAPYHPLPYYPAPWYDPTPLQPYRWPDITWTSGTFTLDKSVSASSSKIKLTTSDPGKVLGPLT